MSLIDEIFIIPSTFLGMSHERGDSHDTYIKCVKHAFLESVIIRDYCNGYWFQYVINHDNILMSAKELLKAMRKQSRFRLINYYTDTTPTNNYEWLRVAEKLNDYDGYNYAVFRDSNGLTSELVRLISIRHFFGSDYCSCSGSVRLKRSSDEYIKHLRLIIGCSKSVMFIDPHINPFSINYSLFPKLIEIAKCSSPAPMIEIHCKHDSTYTKEETISGFKRFLAPVCCNTDICIDVFVWNTFHDRKLLTNIIGLEVPNGFDTSKDGQNVTTWTRISRSARDDSQREFDPASGMHRLMYRFSIA